MNFKSTSPLDFDISHINTSQRKDELEISYLKEMDDFISTSINPNKNLIYPYDVTQKFRLPEEFSKLTNLKITR